LNRDYKNIAAYASYLIIAVGLNFIVLMKFGNISLSSINFNILIAFFISLAITSVIGMKKWESNWLKPRHKFKDPFAHESEEQFETFMRNSPAVAWIKDENGRYVYVNSEFCVKFSVKSGEIVGKTDYDILNHEVVDIIARDERDIIKNHRKKEIHEEIPMPDGTLHHWWVHKFPILSSHGRTFTAGIGFDITEKKKAEEALAESEKRYRLISENTKDIICLHHTDSSFIYVSPSVLSILGYDAGELIGKTPYDFLHHEDREALNLAEPGKIMESENREYRFRRKNGEFQWLETIYQPIKSEDGEILQYQSVSRDISVRKIAEAEISVYMENLKAVNKELNEAKEIAEQSVKIKEEFLANTSHEIRTPMNAIIGLTRLMLDSDLTREQREYLEAIARSGDTLLIVLNDILDMSKIEAGMMTFEEINFMLRDNIRYTIDLLRPKTLEKGIKLNYSIDESVPNAIIGDPVRLNQVLINLLSNAVKFTHQGSVDLFVQVLENANDKVILQFSITDTGIGIPADKLDSIFTSFTQGNKSITRKYGGTGLGLAIVKRLIELQGGAIEVSSVLNEGSCFSFRLCFKKDVNRIPKKETASHGYSNKLAGVQGLLVEDNTMNQLVASQVLKDFGIALDVANNGREALKCMEVKDYDIIFMDLQMPELDGFEATRIIRQQISQKINNVPIIAMSASPLSSEITKCLEAGMNDYISKPFDARNLFNKIVELMNKDMAIAETGIESGEMGKITNLNYLRDLAEGSSSFIEEILVMFIDVIPKSLGELEESLSKKDWDNMKLVAHKMKPSYGFVGVKSAEDIMQRIEKNASELPDSLLLRELLTHAKVISDQCLVELKAELAQLEKK
jgi:PAS domain S-box-containing protein